MVCDGGQPSLPVPDARPGGAAWAGASRKLSELIPEPAQLAELPVEQAPEEEAKISLIESLAPYMEQINELKKQISHDLYARSLEEFCKAAWTLIDPAPLQWNWHLSAMCTALQAVSEGLIRNLLINIAPRRSKSSFVSVLWPAWEWISNPAQTWLCTSYSYDLAIRDSAQTRRLIESPWYRDLFPDTKLMEDANQIERYKTTKGGHRITGSPGGRGLGDGGNRCLIDDPHPSDKEGLSMEDIWNWYTGTFFNRVSDPKRGARVIVGQRLHPRDLSGRIIEQGGYAHLCFQEEYDPTTRCTINIDGFKWDGDPRTKPGELLWPERYGHKEIEELKKNTPPTQYSARYQQRPIPSGGYQFNREWFRYFFERGSVDGPEYVLQYRDQPARTYPVKKCRRICVVDPACTAKRVGNKPCYTVAMVADITPDNDILIIHEHREQEESPNVVESLIRLRDQFNLPIMWIEKAGIGVPTIQFTIKAGIPVREIDTKMGKKDRAQAAEVLMGNGKMWFLKGASWLPVLEREIETFPMSEWMDQVDVISHLAILIRNSNPNASMAGGVISFSGSTGVGVNSFR